MYEFYVVGYSYHILNLVVCPNTEAHLYMNESVIVTWWVTFLIQAASNCYTSKKKYQKCTHKDPSTLLSHCETTIVVCLLSGIGKNNMYSKQNGANACFIIYTLNFFSLNSLN